VEVRCLLTAGQEPDVRVPFGEIAHQANKSYRNRPLEATHKEPQQDKEDTDSHEGFDDGEWSFDTVDRGQQTRIVCGHHILWVAWVAVDLVYEMRQSDYRQGKADHEIRTDRV
jgi:hypothetical protein